ncbi:MAG TPA: methyltransferase domain-containing protein [Candidatus Acidoferrales bacterium]|nr:methyltransferase domain-containing protein [Candidatus Acidoferrales bacterium]
MGRCAQTHNRTVTSPAWDAKLYDEKHAFVWQRAKGLLELLAPKPGERILDLGCGTGHLTAEIASRGADVSGIDRSPEMIAAAKKQYPHLKFEVADARELAFGRQFDAVFSNAALHWILEPARVIRGAARALKPNGRFVAEFGGKGNIRRLIESVTRAWKAFDIESRPEDYPWYYPSVSEYSAILEEHGLEVREVMLFDRPIRLEDGEKGLEIWMRMFWNNALNRVPPERQEEFLREIERQARKDLYNNGMWEIDYRRLRILARKPQAGSPG